MMSLSGSAGIGRRAWDGLSFSFLKNIGESVTSGDLGRRTKVGMLGLAHSCLMIFFVDDDRGLALDDHVFVDDDLFDSGLGGYVVHDVEHCLFEDGTQTARA